MVGMGREMLKEEEDKVPASERRRAKANAIMAAAKTSVSDWDVHALAKGKKKVGSAHSLLTGRRRTRSAVWDNFHKEGLGLKAQIPRVERRVIAESQVLIPEPEWPWLIWLIQADSKKLTNESVAGRVAQAV